MNKPKQALWAAFTYIIGALVALAINFILQYICNDLDCLSLRTIIGVGIVQLMLNSIINQYATDVLEDPGMFSFGLFSVQIMIITKAFRV